MKLWAFLFILPLAAPVLRADAYVRGITHAPGGYRYGHNVPEAEISAEWWFTAKKMTFSSRGWNFEYGGDTDFRFTLDKENGRLLVVNLGRKTFVEMALPLDWAAAVGADAAARLKETQTDGRIEPTGRRRLVLQKPCREYEIREWIIRGDDRYYDRTRTVMACRDVPFDWRLADELFVTMAAFFRPRPDYLKGWKRMQGFIMASEESVFDGGSGVRFTFRVVEMRREKAPADIFSVPTGYQRQPLITSADLFNIRAIFFNSSLF